MIKNIIFDLGGVVLNIDYNRTSEEFQKMGLKNFDNLYSQAKQSKLFDNFEKGFIDELKFREEIRIITGMIFCDFELDKAWNAMLLDLPANRIELLYTIKSNYRTFLLSNTNIIHYKEYTKQLKENHGLESLGELFDKEYYSHQIHQRKPDAEAFNFVLHDAGIKAEETLFIDDSIQHILGAEKVNLYTFFMDHSKNLTIDYLFNKNGQLKNNYGA